MKNLSLLGSCLDLALAFSIIQTVLIEFLGYALAFNGEDPSHGLCPKDLNI